MPQPKQKRQQHSLKAALLLCLTMLMPLTTAHSQEMNEAPAPCPERPNGNEIARLVMTLAAAKYCSGFPHTEEQIEAALQKHNCDKKSGKAIESFKDNMLPKMQELYQGKNGPIMCGQALKFYKP